MDFLSRIILPNFDLQKGFFSRPKNGPTWPDFDFLCPPPPPKLLEFYVVNKAYGNKGLQQAGPIAVKHMAKGFIVHKDLVEILFCFIFFPYTKMGCF